MLKKLTEDKLAEVLEVGIEEFAEKGLDGANVNLIAKKANISVGVLYKYYENKEVFFQACLKKSLSVLESVLHDVVVCEDKILVRAEKMIRAVQRCSREYNNYIKMYNAITSGSGKKYALLYAKEIESLTAKVYTEFIEKAIKDGDIRSDINPRMFAFFFDNLLTMLQFSYCCDYYLERAKIYCGEDFLNDEEKVVTELLKFLESAFTFSKSEIVHKSS
ncbi:TetR/AcrR family transcriptional regulator [Sedimentibacter sp. MB31-C6]|uniref:TetR/AcrR family transcriptional regulator n=1 Tax=Sedimentibacter sp. MB31-C6 TaxID=3109366 RepID=UPI002DDC99EC|nr:TetR/AcrR family transcriptional regulator [Sedimentibacter sp. MB36-C1]WSI04634.1 TetR/AcrR family transcriptional regulator [Sedimentibacter sp. MB36-C1]